MTLDDNPLLKQSDLPYNLPDFSQILPEHLLPALYAAMVEQELRWTEIAHSTESATVQNVVEAVDLAGRDIARVTNVAYTLFSSLGGTEYDALEAEFTPALMDHYNKFMLDPLMYQRYRDVDLSEADEETRYVVKKMLRDFELAGVALPEEKRQKLRKIDSELAALETEYSQRVVRAMSANAVTFNTREELEGLDEAALKTLAVTAAQAGEDADSTYLVKLFNYSNQPLQSQLKKPESRRKILAASLSRGLGADEPSDTRALVVEIARLRARRAKLLGRPNHSEVVAEAGLARNADNIWKLLLSMARPALSGVEREAEKLRELAAADEFGDANLTAGDWSYYESQLRRQQVGVDDATLRPYLELNAVYEKGVFFAAEQLYGLSFVERPELHGYTEGMRCWEVNGPDGHGLALFMLDAYSRPGKSGGAWMSNLVDQSHLWNTRPVILNNLNLTQPAEGEPTLLTWDEVETAFHEFGHALHGIFADTKYAAFSGTSVPRDFVELPSQLNEMWMFHPRVLANYARHYQTGEQLPIEWVEKLAASKTFGQAFATLEFVQSALLDQAWHRMDKEHLPRTPDQVESFEVTALRGAGVAHELVPPRYRSTYFDHTFGGGYDAGYYSYTWAEVLVANLEEWFRGPASIDGDGGLNRAAGDRLRYELLCRGESRDAMESFRAVNGAEPDAQALLRRRGLAE